MNIQVPHLSIVIPAYNEAGRILAALEKIEAFLKQQAYSAEVLIVDDCSSDKTVDVVKKIITSRPNYRLLMNQVNTGKGASVRKGMLAASGRFRLFSDADLSTPIEEVNKFLELIKSYDVIIGSRRIRGARVAVRQPIFREGAGRIFSVLVRLLTLRGFIDTQCGFKLFNAQSAQEVFKRQTIERFGFDVEILYIAKKLGFKIKEAPVTWFDSPFTRVRLLRDSTQMFLDLIRIRVNGWRGRYQ